MSGRDVFLYTETVDDGAVCNEVHWFSRKVNTAVAEATQILLRVGLGEIGLRTLCLGFAEDYDAMVPRRARDSEQALTIPMTFAVDQANEVKTKERD